MAKVTATPNTENRTVPLASPPSAFLHGVEVIEVSEQVRPIQTVKTSVIGLIGTAPEADETVFPRHTPVLLAGRSRTAERLGRRGTLWPSVMSLFAQGGVEVIVIRVPEGESEADTLTHLVGGVDENDHYTGVNAFLACQSQVFQTPRVLLAPYFTHQRPNNDPNPVIQALLPIAERLRAIIIADGPNTTDSAVIDWRRDWRSPRIFVVDPWVMPDVALSGMIRDQTTALPPSPFVAGLIATVDHEQGFWVSPSNHGIPGIAGVSRPVDFAWGQRESRANRLNAEGIATIIHQGGYRLWGNRTCSGTPQWAFLSVRRTADMLHESLVRAHQWAIDRTITRTYTSEVTDSVNAYLAQLKSQGAILDGQCVADSAHNTADALARGEIRFHLSFTPPYPAERLGFCSQLVPMSTPLNQRT